MLTAKDKIRLDKLREYYEVWGILPTCALVTKLVGFSSRAAAYKFYHRLVASEYFGRTPDGRFHPTKKFHAL